MSDNPIIHFPKPPRRPQAPLHPHAPLQSQTELQPQPQARYKHAVRSEGRQRPDPHPKPDPLREAHAHLKREPHADRHPTHMALEMGAAVSNGEAPQPSASSAAEALLSDSPLAAVLGAAGHSRACIMRIRSGRSLTCSCGVTAAPLDDAAKAVGLAIHFARMSATRQVAMPHGVIAALVEQVDAGNAAAILVWQWLARRGQIPAACALRPKLRLVCERS